MASRPQLFTELEENKDTLLIKIVFVGDSFVGKTSLINRLFSDRFDEHTGATIGCDFKYKRYLFDGRSVGVTVWDTAGSEKFSAVTSSYYRGAQGVVLVYDVTRRETFDHLVYWLKEVCRVGCHPDTIRMIVGNKLDLVTPSPVDSSSLPPSDFSILGEDSETPIDDADKDPGSGDFCSGSSDFGGGSSGYREGGSSGSQAPLKAAAAVRQVSSEEAAAFARENGCMYAEMSARRDHNVHDSLAWGVICAIVDTPSLHRANMKQAVDVEPRRQDQGHQRSLCGC